MLLVVFIIPGTMYRKTSIQPTEPEDLAAPTEQAPTDPILPDQITVEIHVLMQDGTVGTMDLEDYVVGVVLAEVPASFNPEALKAQAVASRTFGLKRSLRADKHKVGAVCLNSGCCQGYSTEEAYLAKGGTRENLEKIKSAVQKTRGQVITYDGLLADTAYFSCSGGRTEDAVAVWGADVPYLRSVDSPGEEEAAHFSSTVTFSKNEFAEKLGLTVGSLCGQWQGTAEYSDGGGVRTVWIAGRIFKGTEVRQKLGLRSTVFVISESENAITVTTKGYGHRVGMSQYGANAMANSGSTYNQILAHYYQGTELVTWHETTN